RRSPRRPRRPPGPPSGSGPRSPPSVSSSALVGRVATGLLVDGLGDTGQQVIGDTVLTAVGDDHPQFGLEAGGVGARAATVQVEGDLRPPLLGELAVEVVVELMDGLVAIHVAARAPSSRCYPLSSHGTASCHGGHSPGRAPDPTSPRACANSCNAFWSALLPRWIRLITVPMGTSVISAISL